MAILSQVKFFCVFFTLEKKGESLVDCLSLAPAGILWVEFFPFMRLHHGYMDSICKVVLSLEQFASCIGANNNNYELHKLSATNHMRQSSPDPAEEVFGSKFVILRASICISFFFADFPSRLNLTSSHDGDASTKIRLII